LCLQRGEDVRPRNVCVRGCGQGCHRRVVQRWRHPRGCGGVTFSWRPSPCRSLEVCPLFFFRRGALLRPPALPFPRAKLHQTQSRTPGSPMVVEAAAGRRKGGGGPSNCSAELLASKKTWQAGWAWERGQGFPCPLPRDVAHVCLPRFFYYQGDNPWDDPEEEEEEEEEVGPRKSVCLHCGRPPAPPAVLSPPHPENSPTSHRLRALFTRERCSQGMGCMCVWGGGGVGAEGAGGGPTTANPM
jgi:hypothetical protein